MAQTLKEKLNDEKIRLDAEAKQARIEKEAKEKQAQVEKEAKEVEDLVNSITKWATEHPATGEVFSRDFSIDFGLESYCQDSFLGFTINGSIWCSKNQYSSVYHCRDCFDSSKLRGMALALYTTLREEPLGFIVEPRRVDLNPNPLNRDSGRFQLRISWS